MGEGSGFTASGGRVDNGVFLARGSKPSYDVVCRFDLPPNRDAPEVTALEITEVSKRFLRFVREIVEEFRIPLGGDLTFLPDCLATWGGTRLEVLVRCVDADADLESGTAD